MKSPFDNRGFTLVELMVTIALLSIIAALAVPSFSDMIDRHRNQTAARQLFGSLNYARSMAVSRQRTVTICGSDDGSSCNGSSNWSAGGLVFIDSDEDHDLGASEELLRQIRSVPENASLTLALSFAREYLRYTPTGGLELQGSLKYCPPDDETESGWILVFHVTGRPYFGIDNNGDGVVEDGSGDPLVCGA